MRDVKVLLIIVLLVTGPGICLAGNMSVVNTVHNLSASGPGEIRALHETRVCVFCHTPHNAAPSTPLWNKNLEAVNYELYTSSTMKAMPGPPKGPSRLCLSCHDGTVALGDVLVPATDISTNIEKITSERRSYLGIDISNDHPVSFSMNESYPNDELVSTIPSDLMFYGVDNIECSTCHDAHDNTFGKFLVMDNTSSTLCRKCHQPNGWNTASHKLSTAVWNGSGSDPWPHTTHATVAENACENCHTPHNAGGPKRLMNYQREEENCFPCHNGNVAATDIRSRFLRPSHHRVEDTTIGDLSGSYHQTGESPVLLSGHVECLDCHNPHAATDRVAEPPTASGAMDLVSGIDRYGLAADPAAYEYEVCYKCHSTTNKVLPYINRVIPENDFVKKFDPANPSYHPVVDIGKSLDVPSLGTIYINTLTESSMIYCTDCHGDSDTNKAMGSDHRGPHGSNYIPILREEYERTFGTPESFSEYALCYRCHDRTSILSDVSFQKAVATARGGHSGHLAAGATCSVCHDPHGINDDGLTGDHTHLINFDTSYVTPATGQTYPFFADNLSRSGSCTLTCHGREHTAVNSSYP